MHQPLLAALDAYIAAQPEPQPSRPEAIRAALGEHLRVQGFLRRGHEDGV